MITKPLLEVKNLIVRYGLEEAVRGIHLIVPAGSIVTLIGPEPAGGHAVGGGERQMLAIGLALMGKPRLLLLDEPSLGLAPLIVADIFRVVSELRDSGVSVLLVEQNARAALAIADYGYVLEAGCIVNQGPAKELACDTKLIEAYLGTEN